jgi:hypothetical protein
VLDYAGALGGGKGGVEERCGEKMDVKAEAAGGGGGGREAGPENLGWNRRGMRCDEAQGVLELREQEDEARRWRSSQMRF